MNNKNQDVSINFFKSQKVIKKILPETLYYISHLLMIIFLRSQSSKITTPTKIKPKGLTLALTNFTIFSVFIFYFSPQVLFLADAAAVSSINLKLLKGQITPSAVESIKNIEYIERFDPNECSIYQNENLHSIMDRVCEVCHDMFSHREVNMRAECRSKCFSTKKFKNCLRLFKPSSHGN